MDLYQYFVTQTGRNIMKNPHYFPVYERHFRQFVGQAVTMFEIGTGSGGSCQMWKYYFGPKARIITIDIRNNSDFREEQIIARQGDQSDTTFLGKLIDEFGPPDIVLDDGSHMMNHINVTFDFLFPRMSVNGTYLVEDLDGAYWEERGGGLGAPTSFVERAKYFVDQLNAVYTRGALAPDFVGENLLSISFYKMIVVLEKTSYLNSGLERRPEPLGR
jgi:cephalosporin hydroxylase